MSLLGDAMADCECTWCGALGVSWTLTLDPNPDCAVLEVHTKTAMLCSDCAEKIKTDEPDRLDVKEEKPRLKLVTSQEN